MLIAISTGTAFRYQQRAVNAIRSV